MRAPTLKHWQEIAECNCGSVSVYPACGRVYAKDYKLMNIKRQKDQKTDKYFLIRNIQYPVCLCNDDLPF